MKMTRKLLVFIVLTFSSSTSHALEKDLGNACENMWNKAGNNLKVPLELRVNTLTADPLFELEAGGRTKISQSEVFKKFKELLDSYNSANPQTDVPLKAGAFFKQITEAGGPVEQGFKYLNDQKKLPLNTDTLDKFKKTLEEMWFTTGSIKGGFQHVFFGEEFANEYKGFHNWYQFHLQQVTHKNISILNASAIVPTYNAEPMVISSLKFNWMSKGKSASQGNTMFVGTSPAFDVALFSVCFLALFHGGGTALHGYCLCKIGSTSLKFRVDNNAGKVGTAYPILAFNELCQIKTVDRTNCGLTGIITPEVCVYQRGCCYDRNQACFYLRDHKCNLPPEKRMPCPDTDQQTITSGDCENKGCCFDFGSKVPKCFEGK